MDVLKHLILQQIGVYQYLTKKFMPPGGGWRYKSKKISENVFFKMRISFYFTIFLDTTLPLLRYCRSSIGPFAASSISFPSREYYAVFTTLQSELMALIPVD